MYIYILYIIYIHILCICIYIYIAPEKGLLRQCQLCQNFPAHDLFSAKQLALVCGMVQRVKGSSHPKNSQIENANHNQNQELHVSFRWGCSVYGGHRDFRSCTGTPSTNLPRSNSDASQMLQMLQMLQMRVGILKSDKPVELLHSSRDLLALVERNNDVIATQPPMQTKDRSLKSRGKTPKH